jgi:hypothetical protein
MNERMLRGATQLVGSVLAIGCLVALSLCVWCVLDVRSFVRNAQLVDATIVGFSRPVTEDGTGRAPILRVSLPSEQGQREEVVRLSALYDVKAHAVGRQVPVLYNPEHAVRFALESPWNWIGCYVYGSGALVLLLASCGMFALARRRKVLCHANACVVVMALWCGPLADSAVLGADEPAAQRAADLAPPVLVMAGGKPIDVDGYATPFVGDFDGDGNPR